MPKKIVVIDDEDDVRNVLRMALSSAGYHVEEACDGEAGLKLIERFKPDLAIIDLMMPRMNGYELTVKLQQRKEFSGLKIVILTSLTQESEKDDEQWRESMDVADFISKPVDLKEMIERIGKVLE